MRLKTMSVAPTRRSWRPALGAALGVALLMGSTGPAGAGILLVGNVLTFSSGSSPAGNPQGSWTLDDKTFSYLDQSGFTMSGTGGPEVVRIVDSPIGNVHSFSLQNLGNLAPGSTYTLGYRVNVVPSSPFFLNTVALDSVHLVDTVRVYKDVFSTFSLFNSALGGFGGGDLAALSSLNGAPAGPVSLAGQLTQVWVRDTIVLGPNGQVDAISNTYTQRQVPEIDPTSATPMVALVMGGLAFCERRRRLAAT